MSVPKLKPCPNCQGPVAIWTYDDGWRRAECYACDYIAKPAENLVRAAHNHNERATGQLASKAAAQVSPPIREAK